MKPPLFSTALVLLAACVALALRLPRLDERPMHPDEAVHAHKLGILWETGEYRYDPADFHGPTIYYFAYPFLWLGEVRAYADMTAAMCRIVPALIGVALVLLPLLLVDAMGSRAVVMTAALTAVSPAMTYYSRYYIQEMPLVFFTATLFASAWRYWKSPGLAWALGAGASIGLMQASKETSVIVYASAVFGIVGAWALARWRGVAARPSLSHLRARHLAAALTIALLVVAAFMTGMFKHSRGALDAVRAYGSYSQRSGGVDIHAHPWDFYLARLFYFHEEPGPAWSEALILLLGGVGALVALLSRPGQGGRLARHGDLGFARFIACYTLAMTAVYSSIPYKTPWCVLGFLHGWILLAGFGASEIFRHLHRRRVRWIWGLLLAIGIAQLAVQSYRSNFLYSADPRNPYVYAHTSTDIRKIADRIDALAAISPDGRNMEIHILGPDYWPLPWTLRKYSRVGFWLEPPAQSDAPVLLAADSVIKTLMPRLKDQYHDEFYGLRPNVLWHCLTRNDLWESFIASRQRLIASKEDDVPRATGAPAPTSETARETFASE